MPPPTSGFMEELLALASAVAELVESCGARDEPCAPDLAVLAVVRASPTPPGIHDLARALGTSPARARRAVSVLSAQGLARGGRRVAITKAGEAALDRSEGQWAKRLASALATLPPRRLHAFQRALAPVLGALARVLREDAEAPCPRCAAWRRRAGTALCGRVRFRRRPGAVE